MTVTATRPGPRLPGPPRVPLLGWRLRGLSLLRDPATHLQGLYDRHGPISAWEPDRPKHVFAFGPEYLRALFAEPQVFISDAFREVKMPDGSAFRRLSSGLLRLNGPEHRKHRKLMQPAFTARRIQVHREAIVELTERELAGWQTGETRRLDRDFFRLIMSIAVRTIFDVTERVEIEELQGLVTRLLKVAASPGTLLFPHDVPGSSYRSALRISEQIDATLRALIRERRSTAAGRDDILSAMIGAEDEDGAGLTEDELIGEAYTSFCHDSSSAGLAWTMFLLDQHPRILDEVTDEVRSVLGSGPPDAESLSRLQLLDHVVTEALRLLPPAAFAIRYADRAAPLGEYDLPEGAAVFFSSYVTHRIPELYPRPTVFDPSRWDSVKRPVYEYVPFGAGPHHCIGRHFAFFEMKIILAMLLQRFRPSLVPGSRVDRAQRISLVPSHGLPMRLHPSGTSLAAPQVKGNIHQSVTLG